MNEAPFIHEKALCETDAIGEGTRIWAFAHVLKNVRIGSHCNIGDHAFIESGVTIGNNVTIKNGVCVWQHVHVADNVFLGPNAVLTNDLDSAESRRELGTSRNMDRRRSNGGRERNDCLRHQTGPTLPHRRRRSRNS